MPTLSVENLGVTLSGGADAKRLVDDVSFTIAPGETFCLVGESGSGKSMTALALTGLLPADADMRTQGSATLTVAERSHPLLPAGADALNRLRGSGVAMIFQEPMTCLNPVMTVGDQIVEAIELNFPGIGWTECRERAIAALAEARVDSPEQRMESYPHQLSGGQRQRVMIAMAMACEPALLIADEPTTALDVTVQARILELMAELQARRRMAMLFITHDLGVVARVADTVAVMRHGRIVERADARTLIAAPRESYTQHLLDCVPERMAARREASTATETASATEPLLRVESLAVHFPVRAGWLRRVVGYKKAVDGVDLTLDEGEIAALVGESGCGKTTLGRAVVRLQRPTQGTVTFGGRDITHLGRRALAPLRREIQIAFQDPAASLNPRLSVATALTEPLAVHGIGENDDDRLERAAAVLDEVQLPRDTLWRYPHEFSGGQRQRIGIARALALGPRCLVCDEVTSALDVSVQAELLELLLALRDARGLALLFITHDIGVVEYVSDTTLVMHAGRIVERGPTARVIHAPEHDYTKTLLDAVPRLPSADAA